MKRIAIIGAGNWGTALGLVAARKGHSVILCGRDPKVVDSINMEHVNSRYLPGVILPPSISATKSIPKALDGAEFVILAAPSHGTRDLLRMMRFALREHMIIISATKGIEIETGKRISEVVESIMSPVFPSRFVCLSGPSFASEVVAGHPTAIVAASRSMKDRELVQSELSFENLRIYANEDVVGTELGGSVKNVMAIAAGMVTGLGLGTNTVAALITRGLAEMSRLARRQGGKQETMMGLAGLGDLVLTCTGDLSRNRHVGVELGKGRSLDEIVNEMNGVAEGVKTALAVHELAYRVVVDMPITAQVKAVLYDGKSPADAVADLMSRPLRDEVA
ncbi:MAG TPA: NAD(P)H-dependent glycerol-3-phosphate dehydrogenase [Pyrinomonadaceae bacterium]|nr:NAD(P)H-dependent glycerol-3-phosphate dehydrogenase [Pyrinomonadaceae bacterium]